MYIQLSIFRTCTDSIFRVAKGGEFQSHEWWGSVVYITQIPIRRAEGLYGWVRCKGYLYTRFLIKNLIRYRHQPHRPDCTGEGPSSSIFSLGYIVASAPTATFLFFAAEIPFFGTVYCRHLFSPKNI